MRLSQVKTAIKKVRAAVKQKKTDLAQTTLRDATSRLHKAVTKGTLHRKTASRLVSRLASHVNKS